MNGALAPRSDFPLLAANPALHYLDSAATTQKPRAVLEAMAAYYEGYCANVHRGLYAEAERDGIGIEVAFQYNDGYNENVFSFVNNINTHEGGTHLSGFKSALTSVINKHLDKSSFAKKDKDIKLTMGSRTMEFTGISYLQGFVTPNVYFHCATAYNILRHNGLEIGKGDYMGRA